MSANDLCMWLGAVGAGGTIQALAMRRFDGLDLVAFICLFSVAFALVSA